MVKSVSLIRDPSSQFATHLGYIEFYSVEHAQYALQSYNHAHSGSTNEIHGGVSAAAFANFKAMQRLQKEVAQPGSSLAYNPLVAQALQVAQWSANIGHTAAPPPPPPAPVVAVDSVGSYEQQQQQYAQYALYQQQALQAQQQALLQQQLRWPPHFETNGGAYVYQAKTGCFLEPTSDFYFDPKSKLYYCGKNGAYYSFDEAHVPPFRRFVPPPPSAASVNGSNGTVVAVSYNANDLGLPYPVAQNQAAVSAVAAAPVPLSTTDILAPASSAAGNKVNLGAKTTVGFGLIGTKNKKVKVDLAKWSALQQDDDEEEVVDEKGKGKQKEMLKEHTKNQQEKPSGVEKDASNNGTNNHAGSFQGQEPKVGSKRPLEDSADAFLADFMASSGVANLLASNAPIAAPSMATHASLPPPPPGVRAPPIAASLPVAAVAKSPIVVPAATAAAPVSSLPVCLLCQRQFPSFEMLQRHEKESKLHADNLKKSLGLL
uniref:Uncharacterized protein n=1 Tax=Spumella elongata TaxID=89044 RepID=A0A7S3HDM7_9STRA|mmetsp:Transcript_47464/g.82908  ORF Transcript_47464/g.82908 Transcript_47464/m.82908 type:complete len:487 (+) Transcript_47464:1230-2690(+)